MFAVTWVEKWGYSEMMSQPCSSSIAVWRKTFITPDHGSVGCIFSPIAKNPLIWISFHIYGGRNCEELLWVLTEYFQIWKKIIYDYFLYKGIANESKKLYGVQFHPEVGLTENGKVILKNFLYDIAGCSGTFTVQNREIECIREIKERVGTSKVLVSNLHLKV